MSTQFHFKSAKWIKSPIPFEKQTTIFCRRFTIGGGVRSATLSVSAMGIYYPFLNGAPVSDTLYAPGFTAYKKRVQVQSYDVKELLFEGENSLSIALGNGWAVSVLQFARMAEHTSLIAELSIVYESGETQLVSTDESFSVLSSPVLSSDIYGGEIYDGTHTPTFLGEAEADTTVTARTVFQQGEWMRKKERFTPRLIVTPKGERVLDFGQNLCGFVEIRMQGSAGERIVLSHGEVLDRDGNFYNENYRAAKSLATYILKDGENLLRPYFTFYGFRYVRLDEYPRAEVALSDFCSVAVYSDMEKTGDFHSGNPKINRLYQNVLWGQRSNFLDIPTDCPQRDERVGWTGDAQVFCRASTLNYNVKKFFEKWLEDMMLDQREDGAIYRIVPWNEGPLQYISAGYSDAAVICPWEIYLAYGDRALLREHFPMMRRWVDYVRSRGEVEELWLGDQHYGDWLGMENAHLVGNLYGATQTDLVASAYFYHITELLVRAGKQLGEDMAEYEALAVRIKAAFRKAFMKDGMTVIYPKYDGIATNRPVQPVTQTSLALVLRFGLCTEEERAGIASRLEEMIRENGTHLTTGFLGTGNLLWALHENGRTACALDLLFQERYPSWLYQVDHGATTMWEHWDGLKEDGTLWPATMNSFNHYAYGSVYDFLFGACAGITNAQEAAGYRSVDIRPTVDARFGDHLFASLKTKEGMLSSAYYFEGERIRYELEIPKNTKARIFLPDGIHEVGEGRYIYFFDKK